MKTMMNETGNYMKDVEIFLKQEMNYDKDYETLPEIVKTKFDYVQIIPTLINSKKTAFKKKAMEIFKGSRDVEDTVNLDEFKQFFEKKYMVFDPEKRDLVYLKDTWTLVK